MGQEHNMALAFTEEQIRSIKNHIPTIEKNCRVFISVFDGKVVDETEKIEYLINLVDTMEVDLQEVKEILEAQI